MKNSDFTYHEAHIHGFLDNMLVTGNKSPCIQCIHKRMSRFQKLTINLFLTLTRTRRTPSSAATVQVSHLRVLLNRVLQQRWIGRAAKGDNHILLWPPRSPDLTPCDFFSLGVR